MSRLKICCIGKNPIHHSSRNR